MGRSPCCDKTKVKKGPWSPEEDTKLKDYINLYGTGGNWIALPHKAGLKRCGKSCRLRWLNYLRPNIKHGEFSDDEDLLICSLFSTIGSRWSLIAAQLPGRTDNDIKNYWNTKLKKKLMNRKPPLLPAHPDQSYNYSSNYYWSSCPLISNSLTTNVYSSNDHPIILPSHDHHGGYVNVDQPLKTTYQVNDSTCVDQGAAAAGCSSRSDGNYSLRSDKFNLEEFKKLMISSNHLCGGSNINNNNNVNVFVDDILKAEDNILYY